MRNAQALILAMSSKSLLKRLPPLENIQTQICHALIGRLIPQSVLQISMIVKIVRWTNSKITRRVAQKIRRHPIVMKKTT